MAYLDKILSVVAMGSTVANVSLMQRFLSGITLVITLTTICGTMLGVLTSVAFYGLYLLLMSYGLDQQAATLSVVLLALGVVAALGAFALVRWRQLKEMSRFLHSDRHVFEHAGQVVDAFISGLLTRAPRVVRDNVHELRRRR